ncbi:MAG: hypothetical protein QW808_00915 [Desulfurococcaceae archaeon]
MNVHEVELLPVYMESSGENLGKAVLRRFQKELADIKEGMVLLSAPTGSGKTITLLTDSNRGMAVGLYPNNELICSQVVGLHNFILKYLDMRPEQTHLLDYCIKSSRSSEGELQVDYIPLNIYALDRPIDIFGRGVKRIYIAGMSGGIVTTVGDKGKLDVLMNVADKLSNICENEYAIVLATPDTFFLLALYLYRNFNNVGKMLHYIMTAAREMTAEDLEKILSKHGLVRKELEKIARVFIPLRRSTIFVDEYHLYGFYELSSFKALIYTLKQVHDWNGRLILSSATPSKFFIDELTKELGDRYREVNGINQVKECGDEVELVRGPIKLIFIEVETNANSRISRLYKSSELAYEAIHNTQWFRDFISLYKNGKGRGMAILEKVSHAEDFANRIYKAYYINPVCMYSMPLKGVCAEASPYDMQGGLFVVGTGAKIGQGVEYSKVSFGVVARVLAHDFLQSLSRIGRKYQGESIVLTPVDSIEFNKVWEDKTTILREKVPYSELAKWVEEDGRPFLRSLLKNFENVYSDIIMVREKILRTTGLALHYRLSGTYSENIRMLKLSPINNVYVVAPPDSLYTIALFRSTGPSVSYCRDVDGRTECYEERESLGTIVRNYEVEAMDGRLLIKSIGRGDIDIKCEKNDVLTEFVKSLGDKSMLIGWSVLNKWFRCKAFSHSGARLDDIERELGDQVFLTLNLMNEEFAEYLYCSGRGLRIKLDKGSIILMYI